jgi:hypothetical protein
MREMNKMRDQQFAARISVVFAASTLLSIGCAHFTPSSTASSNKAPLSSRHSAQALSVDAHGDPLGAIEQELSRVQSDRVVVSTALLKSLVRNERIQQTQCKNISGQLEALKNIDLEESQEVRE